MLSDETLFLCRDQNNLVISRRDGKRFSDDEMRLIFAMAEVSVKRSEIEMLSSEEQIKNLKEEMYIPDYMKYDK